MTCACPRVDRVGLTYLVAVLDRFRIDWIDSVFVYFLLSLSFCPSLPPSLVCLAFLSVVFVLSRIIRIRVVVCVYVRF